MSINRVIIPEPSSLLVHLAGREMVGPDVAEVREGRPRTQLVDFAQASEDRQLRVGEAHVGLVRLRVGLSYGLEFGRGSRG